MGGGSVRKVVPPIDDFGQSVRHVGPISTQPVAPLVVTPANVTRVPALAVNQTLIAGNIARQSLQICNNSFASVLYIKYGPTVVIGGAGESFTDRLQPYDTHVVEKDANGRPYLGRIDGMWDVADAIGAALITEIA